MFDAAPLEFSMLPSLSANITTSYCVVLLPLRACDILFQIAIVYSFVSLYLFIKNVICINKNKAGRGTAIPTSTKSKTLNKEIQHECIYIEQIYQVVYGHCIQSNERRIHRRTSHHTSINGWRRNRLVECKTTLYLSLAINEDGKETNRSGKNG
jgi:hypothetical protein